ncbi:hypothetical protein J1N35_001154, partial [Gossypium stocksii]
MGGLVQCTTRVDGIQMLLLSRGLKISNYEFEFNLPNDENELSIISKLEYKSERSRFCLPLYALEAGFHLPAYDFVGEELDFYGVAP